MGSYFSVENNTGDMYWIQHNTSETGLVFAVVGTVIGAVIVTVATAGAASGAAAAGVIAMSTAVSVVTVTAECMIAAPFLVAELDAELRDNGFTTIDPDTTYKSKKMTLSLVRTAYLCKSHTSPLFYDSEAGDYYQSVTVSSAKRDVWTGATDGSTNRYKVKDWNDWETDHTYEIRFTPDALTDAQMENAKKYTEFVEDLQDGGISAIIAEANALFLTKAEASRGLPGEEDEEEVVPPPQPLCFKKDEKLHIVFGKEGSNRLLKRYQKYQQQKKTRGKRDEMEDAMAHGYSFRIEKKEGDKKEEEEEGKVVEKKSGGHPPKIRRAYYKFEK